MVAGDPIEEEGGINYYVYVENGLQIDDLGLVKFDTTCDKIQSDCQTEIDAIIDMLNKIAEKYQPPKFPDNYIPGESNRDRKKRKEDWKAEHKDDPLWVEVREVYIKYGLLEDDPLVKGKGRDKIFQGIWKTAIQLRKNIQKVKLGMGSDSGPVVTCCPPPLLCNSGNSKYKTSGGYIPRSDQSPQSVGFRGKIIVCPSLMEEGGFAKHGGCGCFIMHELMHVYGMNVPKGNDSKTLAIENSMIEIQRIILGAFSKYLCKGYDVN